MYNLLDASIETANKFKGYKEIRGNQGFEDKMFDTLMRRVGFQNGWAWCALFAELCWTYEPYEGKSKLMPIITDNFSANAVRTYENFQKNNYGRFEVSKEPKKGAVVIWEKRVNGNPDYADDSKIWIKGHAGIVSEVHEDYFKSIEGNTNDSGGREGIEVAEKKRLYNFYDKYGLCLKGFIKPILI